VRKRPRRETNKLLVRRLNVGIAQVDSLIHRWSIASSPLYGSERTVGNVGRISASRCSKTTPVDPVQEAFDNAPIGEPLTDEEKKSSR
jgi:hypothetical protein